MVSRRSFLKAAGAATAALAIDHVASPAKAFAATAQKIAGASDRLNVAFIGIGHRGNENINAAAASTSTSWLCAT